MIKTLKQLGAHTQSLGSLTPDYDSQNAADSEAVVIYPYLESDGWSTCYRGLINTGYDCYSGLNVSISTEGIAGCDGSTPCIRVKSAIPLVEGEWLDRSFVIHKPDGGLEQSYPVIESDLEHDVFDVHIDGEKVAEGVVVKL